VAPLSSNPVVPVLWRFVVHRRLRVLGLRMRHGRVVASGDGPYVQPIRRLLVRYRKRKLTTRGLVRELGVLVRRERARVRAVARESVPRARPRRRPWRVFTLTAGGGRRGQGVGAVHGNADGGVPAPVADAPGLERRAAVGGVSVHPPGGTYEGCQLLHLACATPGAEIRFTLDGSEPHAGTKRYLGPVTLTRSCEVRARAFLAEEAGPQSVERFELRAGPVVATPPGGHHQPPLLVTLTANTPEATVRFTIDGSDPGREAPVAPPSGVWLRSTTAVRARAFVDGCSPGPLLEAAYQLVVPQWRVVEPVDRSDPVPHEVNAFLPGFGGRLLAAASLRGRLHANRGAWREDGFALGAAGGWHVLAVADGAGSSRLARVGAEVACTAARDALERRLKVLGTEGGLAYDQAPSTEDLIALRSVLTGAVRAAIGELERAAEMRGVSVQEFSTTLIVALHRRWGEQDVVATIQVGDGAVCAATADGFRSLGGADSGQYAGETRFLTTRGIEHTLDHRVSFLVQERVQLLAVMTDGVADDFFPPAERMPGLLDELLREADHWPDLEGGLLDWLRYERRGSNDDRTLAILLE